MKQKYFQISSSVIGSKVLVKFKCGESISCNPPYTKGKIDYAWINVIKINQYDQQQAEKVIGIKLLPL